MQLYNTLTQQKETFKTHTPGKVGMYTCGPTVYHFAHIGNLRSYIMEDVLEKYLRYIGYDVKRVMNITDVGHLSSDADTRRRQDAQRRQARTQNRNGNCTVLYRCIFCRLQKAEHQNARRRRTGHTLHL